jgi:radical SAM/Cys-rich protein
MNKFDEQIKKSTGDYLHNNDIETLQVNVGLKCTHYCTHCHLEASPERTEKMEWPTMQRIIDATTTFDCKLVDITGGEPELNDNFLEFIDILHKKGNPVQVRTNLTALIDYEREDLAAFFHKRSVKMVGSLPCYLEENVDSQRGKGSYKKSIEAIKKLNELGYGKDSDLTLDLVYNPAGATLPPNQMALEADYKRELEKRFGITFSKLYTITNMPIGRFLNQLKAGEEEGNYQKLLEDTFNPKTVSNLMCRNQVSIGWDGLIYDCDFNLALGLETNYGAPNQIQSFDYEQLKGRRIVTGSHCFGCTAGAGSSCRGALT